MILKRRNTSIFEFFTVGVKIINTCPPSLLASHTHCLDRSYANITIPSCRRSNFISSVTKNNLGKTPKVVIKYDVIVSCKICYSYHTGMKLSIFVYERKYLNISNIVTVLGMKTNGKACYCSSNK